MSTPKVHFFYGLNIIIHFANGLRMKPAVFFRKALAYYVRTEGVIKQTALAEQMGIDKKQVNDYLAGRTNWSEKKRMQVCEIINKDYIEMLSFGRVLYEKQVQEGPKITPFKDLPHERMVGLFQNKSLAREINYMMIEIENAQPNMLEKIKEYVKGLHDGVVTVKKISGEES